MDLITTAILIGQQLLLSYFRKQVVSQKNGIGLGCRKDYPSTDHTVQSLPTFSDMWDARICRNIWGQLPGIIGHVEVDGLHRVMVDGKYCYKPNLFSERGWCRLADDMENWGFCSVSCHPDNIFVHKSRYCNQILKEYDNWNY